MYFTAVAAVLFLALRVSCGARVMGMGRRGTPGAAHMPIIPLGWALSLFLMLTFVVCVAFDLIFPGYAMYESWVGLLPGFVWLTPLGFAIGLIESFLYRWYVAFTFRGLVIVIPARTALR